MMQYPRGSVINTLKHEVINPTLPWGRGRGVGLKEDTGPFHGICGHHS